MNFSFSDIKANYEVEPAILFFLLAIDVLKRDVD